MDRLRLDVTAAPPDVDGFQVEIRVNDVEMTSAGAGVGMDPYDVLVPTNRFVAGPDPVTVLAARCDCGEYGCGNTRATIVRQGDVVHWDWGGQAPMDRRVTFAADAYRREVERAGSDHAWETPDRTAGRLVLETVDAADLPDGYTLDWVAQDRSEPPRLYAALRYGDDQVLVGFDWDGRTPTELAAEVRRVLVEVPPRGWPADRD
jgi:hypothetical protein